MSIVSTPSVPQTAERFMRVTEVAAATALGRSTIYQMKDRGLFPQPVRLNRRTVVWRQSDIDGWMAARIQASGLDSPAGR